MESPKELKTLGLGLFISEYGFWRGRPGRADAVRYLTDKGISSESGAIRRSLAAERIFSDDALRRRCLEYVVGSSERTSPEHKELARGYLAADDVTPPPAEAAPEFAQEFAQDAKAVGGMFGRMAPWYDFQNHLFSLGFDFWWRNNLARSVVPGPTGKVLDLAAGTLDVTLDLCRRYPNLQLIAVDISGEMMEYGMSRKVKAEQAVRITTIIGDARSLPLEDRSVDAVTMAFGIRNVIPRSEALKEIYRVLVPGGRACILEFAPMSKPVLGKAYHWYMEKALPCLAGLISDSRDAFEYFAKSIADFPAPALFCEEMRQAGFPFVQHTPFTLGVAHLYVATRA